MSSFRYEPGPGEPGGERMKLLYISRSVYEGEWHSTPHAHACTEFFYVVSGAGRFQIQDFTFPVGPDDMVIINPQVEHTEMGDKGNPLEYIVFGVQGAGFELQTSEDPRYLAFKCGRQGADFLYYMSEMQREMEQQQAHCNDAAQSLLTLFLIKLLRYKPIAVVEPPAKANRECANIKRYIDTHYTENLTLDMLAEIAHLNKYYLAHAFAREYGMAPIRYLLERRIQESRYFLTNTDYSVSQISQILGFSSPSYFSQRFRQMQGASPTDYRQTAGDLCK